MSIVINVNLCTQPPPSQTSPAPCLCPVSSRVRLPLSINHFQSFHPSAGLHRGTGSRWISLGAKYIIVNACWSHTVSWWCHYVNLCFVCRGGVCLRTVFTVCGDVLLFLCLMAKSFLCRAPNFLFSPLCLLSLPVVFLSRTTLHACLLIISLACLHDVESQAKLVASSSHHCL